MKKLAVLMAAGMMTGSGLLADVIWSENFASTTINSSTFATLGGTANNLTFNTWVAAKGTNTAEFNSNGLIVDGTLRIASNADHTQYKYSGGGIILNPSLFTGGAGTYRLTFDVNLAVAGDGVQVRVFGGRGYDITGATNQRLIVRTRGDSVLDANVGTSVTMYGAGPGATPATMDKLAGTQYQTVGTFTGQFVDFEYNGTDAVGILLSSANGAVAFFDNLQVIPEPATLGLFIVSSAGLLAFRRCSLK
jgi:hypothetical protein